ncbi:MAG: hypothetical protein B6I26_04650 [Desulfobacteraceae bacterium 4572_130]|nr:MAG: hypothetical protein B6I26_04650 [Desulfobacteraceae bacterium 4572_130]
MLSNYEKLLIKKKLLYIVIATGIYSVTAQLVIIREFLSLFAGNEFIIAIIFFNWLVLGGIGTSFQQISTKFISPSLAILSFLSLFLCFTGLFTIIFLRIFHKTLFFYGFEPGFYKTFIFTFLLSAPYCLVLGFLLPFTLYIIKNISSKFSSIQVYMADNIGDALGGALFSFILVFFFTPVLSVFLSCIPLMYFSFILILKNKKTNIKIILCVIFVFVLILMGLGLKFENFTLNKKNCNLEFYKDTPYGRVEVHKYMNDYTFFANGVSLFNRENTKLAEEIVHYGLSQIQNHKDILFVSCVPNAFSEAIKYVPENIDYVEIDPEVSKAMFKFSFLKKFDSVSNIKDDARKYLNKTKKKYNAIIMCMENPDTFQANRYYTKQFFVLAKKHIKKNGVFVFSIKGFDNYPEKNLLKKISCLYATAKTCFKNIMILPSSETYFIMSDKPLNDDIPLLLSKKKINTLYIKNYFYGDITKQRIKNLLNMIDKNAMLNLDFEPNIIKYSFNHWFSKFNSSPFVFGLICFVIFILYIISLRKIETILFFTGFAAMSFEILIIFVFQILFGCIYLKTGIIVTVFLTGLFFGALFGEKWFGGKCFIKKINKTDFKKILLNLDILIVLLILIFAGMIFFFKENLHYSIFFLYSFVFAFFCGLQFSIALKTESSLLNIDSSNRVAGFFAADLMGAGLGLILFSLIFVPFLGIFKAVLCLCLIKIISLGLVQART